MDKAGTGSGAEEKAWGRALEMDLKMQPVAARPRSRF
jgi:hypothetical protein